MGEVALAQVKTLLGQLTDEELEAVARTATALRGKRAMQSGLLPWYGAVGHVLHELVLWDVPPLNVLPAATQGLLERTQRDVLNWLDAVFQPPLTQVEKLWALNWCARLLAEELERRDRPLCLTSLLYATGEIPAVVEQAFPGYAKSGMLRWVLRGCTIRGEVNNEKI